MDVSGVEWNPFGDRPCAPKQYLAYIRNSGMDLSQLRGKTLTGGPHAAILEKEVKRLENLERKRTSGTTTPKKKPFVMRNCPTPWIDRNVYTCYVDETGMGSFAGKMYVTATVLLPGYNVQNVTDSKKYSSAEKRIEVYNQLIESPHVIYHTVNVSVESIDKMGIGSAWRKAVSMASTRVAERARNRGINITHVIIDGSRSVVCGDLIVETAVKGDSKYSGIAAASVIAKTERDRYMIELSKTVPEEWKHIFSHFHGYAAFTYDNYRHKRLILEGKATVHHRKTYNPLRSYLADKVTAALAKNM